MLSFHKEEIEQAARAARIDHFVKTLPQGYDTIVDDELFGNVQFFAHFDSRIASR